jgi:inosine-uridine nucleoside N-ribohydrolase
MNYDYDPSNGKWIIDTDPGVDDCFAILLALEVLGDNLIAMSIEGGNTGMNECHLNAQKICVISEKKHVPIYRGSELNLSNQNFRSPTRIHGNDGLYDIEHFINFEQKYEHVVMNKERNDSFPLIEHCSPLKMIELCYKYDNINLLTIGPLTNLALAFMIDPNIVNKINKVVVMGGAHLFLGNKTPSAEFNFSYDFIAAKVVLDNFPNVVIFTWETCCKYRLLNNEAEWCKKNNFKNVFCKTCISKKLGCAQEGIFPDYGAAICGFFPKTIEKFRMTYADVVVDGGSSFDGGLICSEHNMTGKPKNKAMLVEKLVDPVFFDLFKKIVE